MWIYQIGLFFSFVLIHFIFHFYSWLLIFHFHLRIVPLLPNNPSFVGGWLCNSPAPLLRNSCGACAIPKNTWAIFSRSSSNFWDSGLPLVGRHERSEYWQILWSNEKWKGLLWTSHIGARVGPGKRWFLGLCNEPRTNGLKNFRIKSK